MLPEAALNNCSGFVVVATGEGEGLTRMPNKRNLGSAKGTFKNALQQKRQQIQVENLLPLPIRQIAVITVEIAQRR